MRKLCDNERLAGTGSADSRWKHLTDPLSQGSDILDVKNEIFGNKMNC